MQKENISELKNAVQAKESETKLHEIWSKLITQLMDDISRSEHLYHIMHSCGCWLGSLLRRLLISL